MLLNFALITSQKNPLIFSLLCFSKIIANFSFSDGFQLSLAPFEMNFGPEKIAVFLDHVHT